MPSLHSMRHGTFHPSPPATKTLSIYIYRRSHSHLHLLLPCFSPILQTPPTSLKDTTGLCKKNCNPNFLLLQFSRILFLISSPPSRTHLPPCPKWILAVQLLKIYKFRLLAFRTTTIYSLIQNSHCFKCDFTVLPQSYLPSIACLPYILTRSTPIWVYPLERMHSLW